MYRALEGWCRHIVESRFRRFELTDNFRRHLEDVAKWITGDSPTFGLYLCGGVGNGKSTVLKALGEISMSWTLDWKGFDLVDAKKVVMCAKAYSDPDGRNFAMAERYRELALVKVLAIDDLGEEPQSVMSYGNPVTGVTDLIMERYNRMLTTFVSSNMAASEIGKYYGERVADRFREMMTIVDFGEEPSFRAGEA